VAGSQAANEALQASAAADAEAASVAMKAAADAAAAELEEQKRLLQVSLLLGLNGGPVAVSGFVTGLDISGMLGHWTR